jgi:MFS family permease
LLQDIKADLQLSDVQLGLLTGIAFALFYSLMGIPIARWADRGNRVSLISLTTALWSAVVSLLGFVNTFAQLLLVRIGVAVGEAGCIPPAHSLIAYHFTRAERPRAIARYMMGGPLSLVIGYLIAGWLNELYGWRVTFMLLGLPGLVLAIVVRLTLKESRRMRLPAGASDETLPPPSFIQVCITLWASRTFRHLLLCFAVVYFFGQGIGKWQPAFFIRSFGLQTGELGTWFTVIMGLGSLGGIYWGGELAARYAANNERLQLRAIAVLYGLCAVVSAWTYLSPNRYWAFTFMGVGAVMSATAAGPLFATIQTLVPPRMRATSIALVYLFANLIGMGLGPLATGVLSDAFRPLFGAESLRYALLALSPGYLWGAWHLWRGSHTVGQDLEHAQDTGFPG